MILLLKEKAEQQKEKKKGKKENKKGKQDSKNGKSKSATQLGDTPSAESAPTLPSNTPTSTPADS